MRRAVLKATTVLPVLGMLIPLTWGLATPGYSSISQQLSELEHLSGLPALATRAGALLSGLSIIAFAAVLLAHKPRPMLFSGLTAGVFGISMMSNGLFVMGSPLHGLYAIGLTCILAPACFAAERPQGERPDQISLVAASLTLLYMWGVVTGLDPAGFHGLTQRLSIVPIFGWFSYASLALLASPPVARTLSARGNMRRPRP